MKEQTKLYHGTCRAFLAFALQNEGNFGPENDSISFTPNTEHAKGFAEQWTHSAGRKRLEDYFGEELHDNLYNPIILEIHPSELNLKYRNDCGADEYYLEKGPLDLNLVQKIYFGTVS